MTRYRRKSVEVEAERTDLNPTAPWWVEGDPEYGHGLYMSDELFERRYEPLPEEPSAIACDSIIPQPPPPDEVSAETAHGPARRHCVCCEVSIPACWAAYMCRVCATEDCEHGEPPSEPAKVLPVEEPKRCRKPEREPCPESCDAFFEHGHWKECGHPLPCPRHIE